jgi:hypothetical protein
MWGYIAKFFCLRRALTGYGFEQLAQLYMIRHCSTPE